MIVLLDSGPLGMLANPERSESTLACHKWLQTVVLQKVRVCVPEIADYEVRRELIRSGKAGGSRVLQVGLRFAF